MLAISCEGRYLFNFGGGNVTRVDPTHAPPFYMYFEHDLCRPFAVHGKKPGENEDDEIHWSEIVVKQQHRLQNLQTQVANVKQQNVSDQQEVTTLTSQARLEQIAQKYGLTDANSSVRNVNK